MIDCFCIADGECMAVVLVLGRWATIHTLRTWDGERIDRLLHRDGSNQLILISTPIR